MGSIGFETGSRYIPEEQMGIRGGKSEHLIRHATGKYESPETIKAKFELSLEQQFVNPAMTEPENRWPAMADRCANYILKQYEVYQFNANSMLDQVLQGTRDGKAKKFLNLVREKLGVRN